MTSNNTEICNLIKDAISFMKNEKPSEAIVCLKDAQSKLPDASDTIKGVVELIERGNVPEGLKLMQAVLNVTGCRHLNDFLLQSS